RRRPHRVRAAARPAPRRAAEVQPPRPVVAKNGSFPPLKAVDLRVRPLARAETIPSAWYTDPRFHALDRDAIFTTTWQHVADSHQLGQPGDHVIAEAAGEPSIAGRGKGGAWRRVVHVCWRGRADHASEAWPEGRR